MTVPEILVIIPARGGSKSIPRKNIRLFAGYPLIAFSIAAALRCKMVSRVIVSTDNEEISAVARNYAAETPFLRPVELAADNTTDLPVFQHTLSWLDENENYHPDLVIHLHATSPVRPIDCLDRGIQLMVDHPGVECIRSVVSPSQSPYKMWHVDEPGGQMIPLLNVEGMEEPYNAPRQQLPSAYLQTGHTNVIQAKTILAGSMTGRLIMPLIIDPQYEIDLDTLEDWQYGEWAVAIRKLDMIWPEKKV
jgi:CMP-N-acetylneuraminic acid synthetase